MHPPAHSPQPAQPFQFYCFQDVYLVTGKLTPEPACVKDYEQFYNAVQFQHTGQPQKYRYQLTVKQNTIKQEMFESAKSYVSETANFQLH